MIAMDLFTAQVSLLRPSLLAFLRRRAPQHAEELYQEVWLRVSRSSARPEDEKFKAYVFTVARRLLIDHHRRTMARPRLVVATELPEAADTTTAEGIASANEIREVVERTLAKMNMSQREVFILRTTTDMSFKEIAEHQGVTLNTALGRMHSATKKIAAALETEGWTR